MCTRIIAVDFDGTIVHHDAPMSPNMKLRPLPAAFSVLHELQHFGHTLVLNTMRSGPLLEAAIRFCETYSFTFDAVGKAPGQERWTRSDKCYANLYIDDAALGIPLRYPVNARPCVDWVAVRKLLVLHKFIP